MKIHSFSYFSLIFYDYFPPRGKSRLKLKAQNQNAESWIGKVKRNPEGTIIIKKKTVRMKQKGTGMFDVIGWNSRLWSLKSHLVAVTAAASWVDSEPLSQQSDRQSQTDRQPQTQTALPVMCSDVIRLAAARHQTPWAFWEPPLMHGWGWRAGCGGGGGLSLRRHVEKSSRLFSRISWQTELYVWAFQSEAHLPVKSLVASFLFSWSTREDLNLLRFSFELEERRQRITV